MKHILPLVSALIIPVTVSALTIATDDTCLMFSDKTGAPLQTLYYGDRAAAPADADQPKPLGAAYPASGYADTGEPALRAIHADGNMSTLLVVEKTAVTPLDDNRSLTVITLRDPHYPLFVELRLTAHRRENLIAHRAVIWHEEPAPVQLFNFASLSLPFAPGDYWLAQFYGGWANEANLLEEKLQPGVKLLDSKLGVRAHENRSPMFLLGVGTPSAEDTGGVIGCQFAWSGNFQFAFDMDSKRALRLNVGVNPFGAQFKLAPGEKWESPEALTVFSNAGTGKMSRDFHRWARRYGVRDGGQIRPLVFNNWEATTFNFDERRLAEFFRLAAAAGFEQFLLDDGWFGNKYPRDNDRAGLGDWDANRKKLPNGITGLCRAAADSGIPFGIWIEPEMVNPKSELYEAHPDWALSAPRRPLHLQRNQLVLDLTNPAVQQFSYEALNGLLAANPDVSYVKWDANRSLSNVGSAYLPADRQPEIPYLYNRALYENMARIADAHPNVRMMLCSGGGGRVDYGALRYFHEFWASDNTDPLRRVNIQWGWSYFYPSLTVAAHVTHMGKRPLKFAFEVAMSGRLGMDMDLSKMSPEEMDFTRRANAEYKRLRDVIQLGEQYRLVAPQGSPRCALMYVNAGRAVVFVYQTADKDAAPVKLKALAASATYIVKEINADTAPREFTGAELMSSGLPCPLTKAATSAVYELVKR
ncbi:MAG: alpha-galactosidase [Verrucomicrobiales bacterium]|jgi:alpha-galactosidase|nr:alpha-galactosidase [Verrucomicrobiales bacterium]